MNNNIYKYFIFVIILLFAIGMVSATDNLTQSEDTTTLEKTIPYTEEVMTETEKSNTQKKQEIIKEHENKLMKSDSTPVYVSPDVEDDQEGTMDNPTNLHDAISKVSNEGNIILLQGTTGTYTPTEQIIISNDTTQTNTNKFSLTAENTNIKIDASEVRQLFKINVDYDVTLNNISICNAIDTALYNEGNLTINGEATYENNTNTNLLSGFIQVNGRTVYDEYQDKQVDDINNGNLLIKGNNKFINNNFTHGGSIVRTNNNGNLNVTINGNNTFSNNHIQTSLGLSGGLIRTNGYLTINGTNTFNNNNINDTSTTQAQGGIIYSQNICTITGKNIFTDNTLSSTSSVLEGGVIYAYDQLTVRGENEFKNNNLYGNNNGNGGAISITGSTIRIQENNIFENNHVNATNSEGGAIYAKITNNAIINGSNIFKNNSASKKGGAVNINSTGESVSIKILGENIFEQNHVGVSKLSNQGAAIYITPVKNTIFNLIGSKFINNTATGNGILWYNGGNARNVSFLISETEFTNNHITGSVFINILSPNDPDAHLTITNNTFTDNFSEQTPGMTIRLTSTSPKTIENNTYHNTPFPIELINLTSTMINQEIDSNMDIPLNYNATLSYPLGYDTDLPEKLESQIFINDENIYNTTGNQITIPKENIPKDQETLNIYIKIDTTTSNTITLNVKKPETTINMDDITALINTPTTITATVTTTTGDNITDGTVTFTDSEGNTIAESTVTEGVATATATFTQTGENTIIATYNPTNTLIASSTTTATVTVKDKFQTSITIDEITATAGETITIKANVVDENGEAVTTGKVTFKVNGKTVKDANGKVVYAKVVDGAATADYTVPIAMNGKDINITAVYSGSTKYNKSTETSTVTVAKSTPTFTTEDITATAGSTITLTASITDGDNAINTGKVVFKINGKTVKDTNGKVIYAKVVNGTVSVDYTLPESYKAGNYTVTATFIASGYDRLEASETLTVTA